MQQAQQDKMAGAWEPLTPDYGPFSLLWMYEELGECAGILKKRGSQAVMDDPKVRAAFVEELADTMMFFANVLMCYDISATELSESFIAKHQKNMQRDFVKEHGSFLQDADN